MNQTLAKAHYKSALSQKSQQDQESWLSAEMWNTFPGLIHRFSRRLSKTRSRTHVCESLEIPHFSLKTLKQVHGNTIVTVENDTIGKEQEADGMLTLGSSVLLGIKTADCVPILLVAPQQKVVGALHAGWRGTEKAIGSRAIEICAAQWGISPAQIWVALGPSIGSCCYQVGREVGEPLFQLWGDGQSTTWQRQGEKGYLDLRAINRIQLIQAGVPDAQIQSVGPCTFCHPNEFTSYRREGPHAGRQLSVIGWQPN